MLVKELCSEISTRDPHKKELRLTHPRFMNHSTYIPSIPLLFFHILGLASISLLWEMYQSKDNFCVHFIKYFFLINILVCWLSVSSKLYISFMHPECFLMNESTESTLSFFFYKDAADVTFFNYETNLSAINHTRSSFPFISIVCTPV